MSDGINATGKNGDRTVFKVATTVYRVPAAQLVAALTAPVAAAVIAGTTALTSAQAATLIASGQAVQVPQNEQFPWLNPPP